VPVLRLHQSDHGDDDHPVPDVASDQRAAVMPTLEQVESLEEAMWQLLDDMGADGHCVCPFAKARARIAFEPFVGDELMSNWMSLEDAKRVVEGS
jgi:hypothetical protein